MSSNAKSLSADFSINHTKQNQQLAYPKGGQVVCLVSRLRLPCISDIGRVYRARSALIKEIGVGKAGQEMILDAVFP
jgi:hypothetical protein